MPQSTVSSNLQILEEAGLIKTETQKARKGNQKICRAAFDEVLVMFKEDVAATRPDIIEVAMPVGLYTSCEVSAPCGLCSTEGIIGLLDVPDAFLDPGRMRAGLTWFPRHGDQWGVDAANPGFSGRGFGYGSGPVMRMVIGFMPDGEVVGQNIVPGGQSGRPGSPFFGDQAALWLGNNALPLRYSVADMVAGARGREVLTPGVPQR